MLFIIFFYTSDETELNSKWVRSSAKRDCLSLNGFLTWFQMCVISGRQGEGEQQSYEPYLRQIRNFWSVLMSKRQSHSSMITLLLFRFQASQTSQDWTESTRTAPIMRSATLVSCWPTISPLTCRQFSIRSVTAIQLELILCVRRN